MTSISNLSGLGLGSHSSNHRISKARARTAVKPILKKLASPQEKNSLDLDRGWADQDEQYQYQYRSPNGWGRGGKGGGKAVGGATVGGGSLGSFYEQPSKDAGVSFNEAGSRRYNHSRSISGASHISVATSSSSGPRHPVGAPFVHPFQQTPRTSTPPMSHANSQTSFVDITEDDDNDNDNSNSHSRSHSHSNSLDNHTYASGSGLHIQPVNPLSSSQPSLGIRRPSLASTQRTSSLSDVNNAHSPSPHPSHPPPLRINTSRSVSATPAQSSRLANVASQSDLHLDSNLDTMLESPASPSTSPSNHIGSPASPPAAMSPFRASFEAAGFPRLRAKSDLDTATRAEHLREARRKFELRERAKEEKYAKEEIKRRERADNKRALEIEKQEKHAAALHKEAMAAKARAESSEIREAIARGKHNRKISTTSSGRPSLAMSRTSISRPGTSRKNAPSPLQEGLAEAEKFTIGNYDSLDARSPPAFGHEAGGAQEVVFKTPKRKNTAKKKTQSTWTMFILWLRTKLLRASKGR
ncbi:hypothetical protein GGR52DRAFT_574000 [Hypoxylon sp. FL1284]|nr:hypothetical protein GGR52DRAFT_574000 [Hypoxylon sp. FL1284]